MSPATLERLNTGFKQAAQEKYLRLSATLRQLSEEVARFESDAEEFSRKRFMFFLNRSWVLTSAMLRALESGDDAALQALKMAQAPKAIESIEFATRGVVKRHAPGRFCSFEFRLHCLGSSDPALVGESLSWSCVFPLRKGPVTMDRSVLEILTTVFREIREGRTEEGVKIKTPSTTVSTAEAIGVAIDTALHCAYFGDGTVDAGSIARHLVGSIVKEDAADLAVLKEYVKIVAARRAAKNKQWAIFHSAAETALG